MKSYGSNVTFIRSVFEHKYYDSNIDKRLGIWHKIKIFLRRFSDDTD